MCRHCVDDKLGQTPMSAFFDAQAEHQAVLSELVLLFEVQAEREHWARAGSLILFAGSVSAATAFALSFCVSALAHLVDASTWVGSAFVKLPLAMLLFSCVEFALGLSCCWFRGRSAWADLTTRLYAWISMVFICAVWAVVLLNGVFASM
jgi:hypothetical protein